jgi:ERCC4-type nuclease
MLNLILLDSREPDTILNMQYDAMTLRQELVAGDAWLACDDATIVVERKTIHDLLASIADQRLFNQAAEMVQQSKWAYLVVIGWPQEWPIGGWDLRHVDGALTTVQELGVVVRWCQSDDEYPDMLRAIAARNRGDVNLRPRRAAVAMTREEQILSSLPGIANERAHALMATCGCVADALTYLTVGRWGNAQVAGVGKSTRERVRAALGMRDGCGLWQISDEDAKELEK